MVECSVIYLSRPQQPFEINVITPCGLIPIRNLTALLSLYWDHIADLAARLEGLLTKISKQSIMTATLVLKYFRNDTGIEAIYCSRSGHTIKNFILQYIRSIHFKNVYILIHQISMLDLVLLNLTLTASMSILVAERNSVSNLHFLV